LMITSICFRKSFGSVEAGTLYLKALRDALTSLPAR
jgi:hypothetical protein